MHIPFRSLLAAAGALAVAATAASADILVMKSPEGQIYITNRGSKTGYKLISRHREFFGSSGLGLRFGESRNAALYDETVQAVAGRHALDPYLVKAVIRAESNFNPQAVSPKGAMGLMQLMPDTARQHEVRNAFDPADNIAGGVRHLRYLWDRYRGDVDLVLAAYNAGTRPVDRVKGIPNYPETQEYVRRVRHFHATYAERAKNAPPKVEVAKADGTLPAAAAPRKPLVARVEPNGRPLEQIYGVPIIVRAAAEPSRAGL